MSTAEFNSKSSLNKEIIAALLYFDLFKHPLNEEEIAQYLKITYSKNEFDQALKHLVDDGLVYKKNNFYSLASDDTRIDRRIDANKRAIQRMKTALRVSRFAASIPYVRGIFLSGTIAKGVMYKDSDIDFFIITAPNRLWICKLFLKFFKFFFLLNSRQHFCYNYLISIDKLKIDQQNLYTATELVTLIPTFNYDLYLQFINENTWRKDYFPNFPLRDQSNISTKKTSWIKSFFEKLFNNKLGDWVDEKYMNLIQKKYNKKYSKALSQKERDIALRTTRSASKVHPRHYQKSLLERYEDRMQDFEGIVN